MLITQEELGACLQTRAQRTLADSQPFLDKTPSSGEVTSGKVSQLMQTNCLVGRRKTIRAQKKSFENAKLNSFWTRQRNMWKYCETIFQIECRALFQGEAAADLCRHGSCVHSSRRHCGKRDCTVSRRHVRPCLHLLTLPCKNCLLLTIAHSSVRRQTSDGDAGSFLVSQTRLLPSHFLTSRACTVVCRNRICFSSRPYSVHYMFSDPLIIVFETENVKCQVA